LVVLEAAHAVDFVGAPTAVMVEIVEVVIEKLLHLQG
jgi:hypothetical protein